MGVPRGNGRARKHDGPTLLRQAGGPNLGLAVLVAESASRGYEPVSVVMSVREAIEVSRADLSSRMSALEAAGDPLCPAQYVVWVQSFGQYRRLYEITAEELR
jgi:hypothetical protein